MPRPVFAQPRFGFPLRGVDLNTETIGLNYRSNENIEIGIVAFSFNGAGEIGDFIGVMRSGERRHRRYSLMLRS